MHSRRGLAAMIIACGLFLLPSPARADIVLTPFYGVTFGGDAPKARPSFGGGITFVGRSIGLEIEGTRTPDFFADSGTRANVTTLTAALVGGGDPPGAGVKPYFLSGVGLMRTNVSAAALLDDTSYNNFAILLGVGLNAFFTDELGLRADLRYFRRLERPSGSGVIPIASNFDFWRFIVGFNARF